MYNAQVRPGEHVVIVGSEEDALRARAQGLHLRDTITILLPGPRSLTAFLFRAPLDGTVAENVLKHGTGALNIDGCRVTTTDNLNGGAYSHGGRAAPMSGDQRSGASLGMFEPGRSAGIYRAPSGRWPTNLVLVHGPRCVEGGCQPDCPVRVMDEQSGECRSGSGNKNSANRRNGITLGHDLGRGYGLGVGGDSGTASRYYPQFATPTQALRWLCVLAGVTP